MANYEVIRVKKISSYSRWAAMLGHGLRERSPAHVDQSKSSENVYYATDPLLPGWDEATAEERRARCMGLIRERIDGLRRMKNSVLGLEYLVSASTETKKSWSRQQAKSYLDDAVRFIHERHHRRDVVCYTYHFDEVTGAHAHVYTIPTGTIKDKHGHSYKALTCREYTGGRDVLSKLQDHFHAQVGSKHGLDRGVKRSGARHQDIQRAHALIANGPTYVPTITLDPVSFRKQNQGRDVYEVAKAVVQAVREKFVAEWGPAVGLRQAMWEQEEATRKRSARKKESGWER